MSIIATETGDLAADNIAEIFAGASDEVEKQLASAEWAAGKLAEAGWTALTATGSDADLTLRDIQQIARVAGRSAVPTALTTTLLAGRWFDLDESQLAGGVTVPTAHDDAAVLPYALPGVSVVDGSGRPVEHSDEAVDAFAALLPLGPTSASAIGDQQRAELAAVLAATATGCADTVLARSVNWVQTREQFGQPLKAFQALRHHLANAHIAREEAWTCAIAAGDTPDRAVEWATIALQRVKTVIELGIQVHGGIGFTWESGIHHWLRHVLAMEPLVR